MTSRDCAGGKTRNLKTCTTRTRSRSLASQIANAAAESPSKRETSIKSNYNGMPRFAHGRILEIGGVPTCLPAARRGFLGSLAAWRARCPGQPCKAWKARTSTQRTPACCLHRLRTAPPLPRHISSQSLRRLRPHFCSSQPTREFAGPTFFLTARAKESFLIKGPAGQRACHIILPITFQRLCLPVAGIPRRRIPSSNVWQQWRKAPSK